MYRIFVYKLQTRCIWVTRTTTGAHRTAFTFWPIYIFASKALLLIMKKGLVQVQWTLCVYGARLQSIRFGGKRCSTGRYLYYMGPDFKKTSYFIYKYNYRQILYSICGWCTYKLQLLCLQSVVQKLRIRSIGLTIVRWKTPPALYDL